MSNHIITPKTPTGTMELLPREQIVFQNMLDTIRQKFERYGFLPIETPVFEETNILLTKSGGDTEKQVYFVQSTGSRQQGHAPDLALRFDLTVPLARYVAEHQNELAFPFRRYQMQRVYRGERAQKGRFREFYQCDIDVIGRDNLSAAYDAEMPVVIADIFRDLKIGAFTINVSNRKILSGYMKDLQIDSEKWPLLLREIDKADKIGWDKVKENIQPLVGKVFDELLDFMQQDYTNEERIRYLEHGVFSFIGAQTREGLDEIKLLLKTATDMGAGDVIRFNPAITRGLDYYTGTVYETFLNDHKNFGSICSGGRYDNLASYYTKSKLPGVGISIGLTRLFEQMRHAGLVNNAPSTVKILITMMDETLSSDYRRIATELRKAGINTEIYLEQHKLDKQFKYADKAGIGFALVMGGDEKAKGVVALKNLQTREQTEIKQASLVTDIVKAIS
ncbi:MAG: histidine--tRNA ligase [Alphaproteobacteria bacterium]|nr:histidine--tRNA ligase [Alphaproteobacteria bacterium]